MLDFTSALYLGFRHPSQTIRPWNSLTTGAPAALVTLEENILTAQRLARLQGCERGTLAPSTLHLFWDLFGILRTRPIEIYLDSGVYPITRWGVERAATHGARVYEFRSHHIQGLQRLLAEHRKSGKIPVIVADGYNPGCGKPTPVREYLEAARKYGGYLVIDDTQALGIFGYAPAPSTPYGRGGGGTLPFYDLYGPEILVVSSLAKGFGAPVAVMAGSQENLQRFESESATRVHCSQPSAAVVHAAIGALDVNERYGEVLRLRLAGLVRRFREGLSQYGLSTLSDLFPVQTITPVNGPEAIRLYNNCVRYGIHPVLHRGVNQRAPKISFIITAAHTSDQIDRALEVVSRLASKRPWNTTLQKRLAL